MFTGTSRFTKGALVASLLALAGAATASTGNGNGGKNPPSTSTIRLAAPVGAAATSGPRYGDTVRFDISTDTPYPFVNLNCYQNGNLVAVGWAGYFDGALGTGNFGLYSPIWTGGAAHCTASLDMNTSKGWKVLASTSFDVAA
jgi:hypothetical protein